jgi:hypothetical protein
VLAIIPVVVLRVAVIEMLLEFFLGVRAERCVHSPRMLVAVSAVDGVNLAVNVQADRVGSWHPTIVPELAAR